MKRIFACKLYKSLPISRRDHVKAAISNPINSELVSQLKEYLDDDYQEIIDNEIRRREQEKELEDNKDRDGAEVDTPEYEKDSNSPRSTSSLPHKPSGGGLADKFSSLFEDEEDGESSEVDEPSDFDSLDSDVSVDDSIEESTDIVGVEDVDSEESISIDDMCSQLVEKLNSDTSTAGIVRSSCRGDEIWLYYSDSINLNVVMSSVIESAVAMFPSLEFNRLARTDNAIVFQHNS